MDRLRGLSRTGRLVCAVAVAVALFAMATGAQASSRGALTLVGGHSGAAGRSCGVAPSWTYYRAGGIARYVGHVTAPVTSVKLLIWRCYRTGFRIVETLTARVTSAGAFKGSFAVNVHSDCFAQASSPGWHSNRAYFRVR